MKNRARVRINEDFNYWPSFVDVMTIVSLVFFFIMIISLTLTYAKYGKVIRDYAQYEKLKKENEALKKQLRENEKNIDNIAKKRKELYEQVVTELRKSLYDNVSFREGRIDIKSDVLFDTNSSDLNPAGKKLAGDVAAAFYRLLKDKNYNSKIESIEIRGHTDNVGGGELNRRLSTERAVSFLNEMLPDSSKYEAYASKFKASGMSKYAPVSGTVNSQSENDKDRNRRIEIYIKFIDDDIAHAISNLVKANKK